MFTVTLDFPTMPRVQPIVTEHETLDEAAARHEHLVCLHETGDHTYPERIVLAEVTILSTTNLQKA